MPHHYGNSRVIWDHSVKSCHLAEVIFPPLRQPMKAGTQLMWCHITHMSHYSNFEARASPLASIFVSYVNKVFVTVDEPGIGIHSTSFQRCETVGFEQNLTVR